MRKKVAGFLSDFADFEEALDWLAEFGIEKFEQHLSQGWDAMVNDSEDENGCLKDYHLSVRPEKGRYTLKITKIRRERGPVKARGTEDAQDICAVCREECK